MMKRLLLVTAVAALTAPGGAARGPADADRETQDDVWRETAQAALDARLEVRPNHRRAKNVILFWSDGVSPALISAARIYEAQQRGEPGEENFLAFERFPYAGFAKTYSADAQIPDSAATATAVMTGVKTHNRGVSIHAGQADCINPPENLGEFARASGRAVGVITTTAITDASPASVYAHTPQRAWQLPQQTPESAEGCTPIADQLIAADLEVALGGGRAAFTPTTAPDPEEDAFGAREDGRDLIAEWRARPGERAFVTTADDLAAVDAAATDRLFGLFAREAMDYETLAGQRDDNPSLAQMTVKAIEILSKDRDGYFLFVEHEGTDEFQHAGLIRHTLDAMVEFNEAVKAALELADLRDTLIVVTSDHGQPFMFGGGAPRGNPILGLSRTQVNLLMAADGKPAPTVGFLVGPQAHPDDRPDPRDIDMTAYDYIPPSAIPRRSVPHSGNDVAIFSTGPWADLFAGVSDQHALNAYLRHAMEPRKRR